MFKRSPKKINRILRIFLKLFNLHLIDRDNFKLIGSYVKKTENLIDFNKKIINLSLGYTNISRKIISLDIVYRYCPAVLLWNSSNKNKRIVPLINKKKLIKTSLKSLKNSIIFSNISKKIKINLHLVADQSNLKFDTEIKKIFKQTPINISMHQSELSGNRGSFLECCNIAKTCDDLIFFVEDDYLFEENAIEEIIISYSKISSVLKKEIFLCPTDFPFYYDTLYKTSIILGHNTRWRFVGETLLTFLLSKKTYLKYEMDIKKIGLKVNSPFEKPLHKIFKKVPCLSPISSLAYHISTGVPSVSENWKKLWDKNC
tara:strand:- start:481 stop:1425 length:945 start_codon:yes stop_codon:yes gene_type:complete